MDNYRANLEALAEAAAERGVPVMLGTLVSNLRGFYPLRSDCGGDDRGPRLAEEAAALLRQGRKEELGVLARESLKRSPECAAAHFELARLQEMEGRNRDALVSYGRARDLDRVPFRAPAVFNEILRGDGPAPRQRHPRRRGGRLCRGLPGRHRRRRADDRLPAPHHLRPLPDGPHPDRGRGRPRGRRRLGDSAAGARLRVQPQPPRIHRARRGPGPQRPDPLPAQHAPTPRRRRCCAKGWRNWWKGRSPSSGA